MKFALLGSDPQTLALADAALAAGAHEVVCIVADQRQQAAALRPRFPSAEITDDWRRLFHGSADAAIVGRAPSDDERLDPLRLLVQSGTPLLLSHPVHQSLLVYYELDMHRQESRCFLLPYLPARFFPAVARLRQLASGGEASSIGALEQVALERAAADRSRRHVLDCLAGDVDLARLLAGTLDRVAAMAPAASPEDLYANLGVQMSGPGPLVVRWSIGPVEQAAGLQLSLVGSRGKLVLEVHDTGAARLQLRIGDASSTEEFPPWHPEPEAISLFVAGAGSAAVEPAWDDALRSMELVDAVEQSVRRGRTVQLHHEEASEHNTFKGLMAAGGCLLLLASLVLLLVAVAAGGLRVRLADYWPHFLLAVLSVFLLLQALQFVFPASRKRRRPPDKTRSPTDDAAA